MQPEDRIRLMHMLDAARAAQRFVVDRVRVDLDDDEMLLFAVIRAVEVIGEAASRVTEAARAAHPDIPWKPMVGMRNRMVHAYFEVDRDVVWQTVTQELPALSSALRAALAEA